MRLENYSEKSYSLNKKCLSIWEIELEQKIQNNIAFLAL